MTEIRTVTVEGRRYDVTLSDEQEALLAADAAGRAIIGIWDRENPKPLSPALYVTEDISCVDEAFLERVVRRRLGLPWILCETPRLVIREFQAGDAGHVMREEEDTEDDFVFRDREALNAYIENQYVFYEYGIWAVVEKATGTLVGKAGVTRLDLDGAAVPESGGEPPLELGYHIFRPYRRQGYGEEACRAILSYASGRLSSHICARVDPANEASLRLAEKLGFRFISQRYSEVTRYRCLYGWCCSQW